MQAQNIRPMRQISSPLPDIAGLGGALAGLAGGLAMAITAAIIAWISGGDIWMIPKQIAAMVYGEAAILEPGFVAGPVIVGSLLHVITSATLGAIYGILSRRVLHLPTDFGTPLLTGLIYGMLVWMVAYFVVLPVVNPYLLSGYDPVFMVQHIVFGTVMGLVYMMLRPAPYTDFDAQQLRHNHGRWN